MKKFWHLLTFMVLFLGIICSVRAASAPYFINSSSTISESSLASNTMDYSNSYYNPNSNYTLNYIFSRSMCDVPIETTLRGKSTSHVANVTRFHLANGQIWKQYVFFGGQVVDVSPSNYRYIQNKTPYPKITISRNQNSYECRVKIDGSDTGIMVYREF